jgi:hypothetical protein
MQDKIIIKRQLLNPLKSGIKFIYFGITGANENCINEEVKSSRNTY